MGLRIQPIRNGLSMAADKTSGSPLVMDDLVVVQIFASNVADYEAFNEVYRTFFTSEFPARAFLGSGTLLFGARFEVMGIDLGNAFVQANNFGLHILGNEGRQGR